MGCATSKERFAACKSLLDYGFATFAVVTPEIPEQACVPVRLGTKGEVMAVPASREAILIDKSQKSAVNTKLELDPEVTAPVSKGQRLGTLRICAGEQVLTQIPLVAEEAVERLTWGQMFLRILKKLCMARE
jgi:D-alanyl-D-alanine carboxypeptidase (penicillin-binding protein 5/6)